MRGLTLFAILIVALIVVGFVLIFIPFISGGGDVVLPGSNRLFECNVNVKETFFGFAKIGGASCERTKKCSIVIGSLASIFGAEGQVKITSLPSGKSSLDSFLIDLFSDQKQVGVKVCAPPEDTQVKIELFDKNFVVRDTMMLNV